MSGVPPAIIQAATLRNGVKGQALFFDEQARLAKSA